MVIVNLKVYTNNKAKEGTPKRWVNLHELWQKVHYKIPYARWAKYTCLNHGIAPRLQKRKTGERGQPTVMYFIPIEEVHPILKSIERRKHVEIVIDN